MNSGCNLAAASRINSDGKVGSGFASAGLSRRLAPADAPSFSFSSEQVEMHARFFPRAAIARRVIQRSHSPKVLSSILTCRMFLAVAWLSSGKRRGEEDAWAVRPSGKGYGRDDTLGFACGVSNPAAVVFFLLLLTKRYVRSAFQPCQLRGVEPVPSASNEHRVTQ